MKEKPIKKSKIDLKFQLRDKKTECMIKCTGGPTSEKYIRKWQESKRLPLKADTMKNLKKLTKWQNYENIQRKCFRNLWAKKSRNNPQKGPHCLKTDKRQKASANSEKSLHRPAHRAKVNNAWRWPSPLARSAGRGWSGHPRCAHSLCDHPRPASGESWFRRVFGRIGVGRQRLVLCLLFLLLLLRRPSSSLGPGRCRPLLRGCLQSLRELPLALLQA